ncbi:isopeptide-forming domain-containing fimbrial protein [Vagococcus sp. BWB3-3]|uniref:Isopeptide-forming domain-containing fimbrial protein n=1 Tax=Vagococcus allomyrinae TaxID=2794353 RepID=A0A940PE67_9ENTE|nr:SpaA isopeptide-forming pilin-related protein [Vagococcus allomyrinae]MBP1042333.1 isopeptide-forming domain-containing fimbrial protein [Vagococcus allomyrinae]
MSKWKLIIINIVSLLIAIGSLYFFPSVAKAALPYPTKVDPYNNVTIKDSNDLYFYPSPGTVGTFQQSFTAPINIVKYSNGSAATLGVNYTSFEVNGLTNIKSTDWVKATYKKSGQYKESLDDDPEVITTVLTFYDFKIKNIGGRTLWYLQLGEKVTNGYAFGGMASMKLKYEFYWETGPKAGQKVDITNRNAVLTFTSLNGYTEGKWGNAETVAPLTMPADGKAYIIDSVKAGASNVGLTGSPAPGYYTGEAYQGFSDNFVDGSKDITFHRNSVAIDLGGESHIFVILPATQYSTAWFATESMNLFRGNPGPPKKSVKNEQLVDIDGAEVLRNQTLYYEIKQRTAIIPSNILTPWASFSIMDSLPAEVDYVSADLYTEAGVKLTGVGTIQYAPGTHKVTYTANSYFLNTVAKYTGERYILRIKVKVKGDVPVKTIIKNKGSSNIETLIQETNEVSNKIPYGNLELTKVTEDGENLADVEFSVKDSSGKEHLPAPNNKTDVDGKIEILDLYPGKYTITEVSVPKGYQIDTTPKLFDIVSTSKEEYSKIEIVNYFTRFKIHLRQAVLNNDGSELVIPKSAYFELANLGDGGLIGNKFNTVANSSIDNGPVIDQKLFTTRVFVLKVHKGIKYIDVSHTVPEYYEYLGYTVSDDKSTLSLDHVSGSPSFVANSYPRLDYSLKEEYWVTVYIQPKYGKDAESKAEESPRPYSLSHLTNEFGSISID